MARPPRTPTPVERSTVPTAPAYGLVALTVLAATVAGTVALTKTLALRLPQIQRDIDASTDTLTWLSYTELAVLPAVALIAYLAPRRAAWWLVAVGGAALTLGQSLVSGADSAGAVATARGLEVVGAGALLAAALLLAGLPGSRDRAGERAGGGLAALWVVGYVGGTLVGQRIGVDDVGWRGGLRTLWWLSPVVLALGVLGALILRHLATGGSVRLALRHNSPAAIALAVVLPALVVVSVSRLTVREPASMLWSLLSAAVIGVVLAVPLLSARQPRTAVFVVAGALLTGWALTTAVLTVARMLSTGSLIATALVALLGAVVGAVVPRAATVPMVAGALAVSGLALVLVGGLIGPDARSWVLTGLALVGAYAAASALVLLLRAGRGRAPDAGSVVLGTHLGGVCAGFAASALLLSELQSGTDPANAAAQATYDAMLISGIVLVIGGCLLAAVGLDRLWQTPWPPTGPAPPGPVLPDGVPPDPAPRPVPFVPAPSLPAGQAGPGRRPPGRTS